MAFLLRLVRLALVVPFFFHPCLKKPWFSMLKLLSASPKPLVRRTAGKRVACQRVDARDDLPLRGHLTDDVLRAEPARHHGWRGGIG